jgi:hypothetical protein
MFRYPVLSAERFGVTVTSEPSATSLPSQFW